MLFEEKENEYTSAKRENVILNQINPHVKGLSEDHLYHIALSTTNDDLEKMFGDVKFVCFGGQASRMERFAQFIATELKLSKETTMPPKNFAGSTDRYAVYKAGPVLSVSHGIGIPSLSIIFQEIVKLLYHAKCKDVTFFRIGTCGGLVNAVAGLVKTPIPGLNGGTVVVSEKVVNGAMQPTYPSLVLGKPVERPAVIDKELANDLRACAEDTDDFQTILGTTLCTDDFYEGQGRIDGAFCDHDGQDRMNWLSQLKNNGVTNMEMESLGFIAMCHRANIRGAVACAILIDRLLGDTIATSKELLTSWQKHPQILVARYIRKQLDSREP